MSALLFPTQQLRCSGFEGIFSARNIKGTPKVLTNVKDKFIFITILFMYVYVSYLNLPFC